jgi:hypothetical protein
MLHDEEFLLELVERLRVEYGCHTVLLYGSRARGDATPQSDYDVIAFRDAVGPVVRDTGIWRGGRMDLFVYPNGRLEAVDAELMHLRGGRVLLDRDGGGRKLLQALEAIYARGPEPLAADEIAARRAWAWKTLDRASRGDVEGDYRRAWLLTMLLEDYFLLRGSWYQGSKRALQILGECEPETFALFEKALAPNTSIETIAALVEKVSGPPV